MASLTSTAVPSPGFQLPPDQRRLLRWTIYVGFAVLAVGVLFGLVQALSYARVDVVRHIPVVRSYYQGLTVHGVANVLIFTFAFANGFLPLMTARALDRPLSRGLLRASFGALVVGTALVAYAVGTNRATVLYTSYAPLQAHWTYYLGLVLVVVSTWLALGNMLVTLRAWRRDNPGARIPLLAFIATTSYLMWFLASLPIAVEFLVFLLPWTLGVVPRTDPLLARTLFWFTGHAIVYAWLLPAYVSWYALIPRQVGGHLVSDSYTRIVWILFLLLSIPVGIHHQFADPGISTGLKTVHAVLTFGVFLPSLATAFAVMAALEIGGRRRGGRGLLGWIPRLPWGDPSVAAQLLAMVTFVLGGTTGLINASLTMNQVVHNTTWVPGHFHLAVGTAVALTYMGIAYWLIPYLTGRTLMSRELALASTWTYTLGVLVFARGMASGGLEGMPRRTFMAQATYYNPAWRLPGTLTGIGGTLMFTGAVLFFLVIALTATVGRRATQPQEIPVSMTLTGPAPTGWETRLDNLPLWVAVAVGLILLAYGPFFATYVPHWVSPGFRPY
jgi:cytochrome c oxidase subunit 1